MRGSRIRIGLFGSLLVVISLTAGCMGAPAYSPPRPLAPGEFHLGLAIPAVYYSWAYRQRGDLLAYPELYGRLGLPLRLDLSWAVDVGFPPALTLDLRHGIPLGRNTWLFASLRGRAFLFINTLAFDSLNYNPGALVVIPALAVGHEPVLLGAGALIGGPADEDSSLALMGFQLFFHFQRPVSRDLSLWAGAAINSYSRGFWGTSTDFAFPFQALSLAVGANYILNR